MDGCQPTRPTSLSPSASGLSSIGECAGGNALDWTHGLCADFLHRGLSLTHYGLIAAPGGVQLFSPSDENAALRTHGGVWLDFMAKLMNADRCILIGHADCRWYIENRIARDANSLKDDETRDINAVREALRRRFPSVNVELCFAELKGSQAEFTAL